MVDFSNAILLCSNILIILLKFQMAKRLGRQFMKGNDCHLLGYNIIMLM